MNALFVAIGISLITIYLMVGSINTLVEVLSTYELLRSKPDARKYWLASARRSIIKGWDWPWRVVKTLAAIFRGRD